MGIHIIYIYISNMIKLHEIYKPTAMELGHHLLGVRGSWNPRFQSQVSSGTSKYFNLDWLVVSTPLSVGIIIPYMDK